MYARILSCTQLVRRVARTVAAQNASWIACVERWKEPCELTCVCSVREACSCGYFFPGGKDTPVQFERAAFVAVVPEFTSKAAARSRTIV